MGWGILAMRAGRLCAWFNQRWRGVTPTNNVPLGIFCWIDLPSIRSICSRFVGPAPSGPSKTFDPVPHGMVEGLHANPACALRFFYCV